MTAKKRANSKSVKKADCTIVNQNCTIVNHFPQLVAVIKEALPPQKAAWHLHYLSGASLSMCQKVLSGDRPLNLEIFLAVLRSEIGFAVLRTAIAGLPIDDDVPPWFEGLNELIDIQKAKRDHLRIGRALNRRESALLEKEGA